MAILAKDGQLIANASQRTLVFDNEDRFAEFRDSLPDGANVFQSFDIYIRDVGKMYAAGTPFKLRETVEAPMELHISLNGTGDGSSAEKPMGYSELMTRLTALAANYDFNFNPLLLYFAPGRYMRLQLFGDFLNCMGIGIMPEPGYETLFVQDDTSYGAVFDDSKCVVFDASFRGGRMAGYTLDFRCNTYVNVNNVGIVCIDGGIEATGADCFVNINGCAFQVKGAVPMNPGYYSIIHATEGGNIFVISTYGLINQFWLNLEYMGDQTRVFMHDAMFMADFNGMIRFGIREDVFKTQLENSYFAPFTGKKAIFMASDLGTINLSGVPKQTMLTIGSIDAGNKEIIQSQALAGWAVSKRNGVVYLPEDDRIPHDTYACCDNTATLIREGEE